jgi:polar amino acid transport system substrate-binding protein
MPRSLLAVVSAVVLVAACSSTAPAAPAAPTTFTLNGSPLPQYAPPSKGLLADIKARGVIFNGVNAANPPFESVDSNGVIVGYDADLTEQFATYLGVHLSTVDTAWSGVIPSLYSKKFDLIWSAMSITNARKEAVTFSSPYAADQAIWITKASNTSINKFEDLNGKKLCTQLNSAYESQAKEIIAQKGLKIEVKSFDDFPTAYLALENGQCDAATSSTLNNLPLNTAKPGVFRNAIVLDTANYVGVATRKPDADLAAEVQKFLDQIKSNGKLVELQKKWFGNEMKLPPSA